MDFNTNTVVNNDVTKSMWERREVPTSGIGVDISNCSSLEEVLYRTGLDFKVEAEPVYQKRNGYFEEVPKFRGITRSDTGKVFGYTTSHYHTVQNRDAFSFVDNLLLEGATFDKAGAMHGGQLCWLQMRAPRMEINGEEFDPYIFLSAGHDGKAGINWNIGTFRAMCCNQIKLVMRDAKFRGTISHKGNVEWKLAEAKRVMEGSRNYLEGFRKVCEELRDKTFEKREISQMIDILIPQDEKETDTKKIENIQKQREHLAYIYLQAPDLQNENDNGYRFLNAVADYESHNMPQRETRNWKDNRALRLATQKTLVDEAYALMTA